MRGAYDFAVGALNRLVVVISSTDLKMNSFEFPNEEQIVVRVALSIELVLMVLTVLGVPWVFDFLEFLLDGLLEQPHDMLAFVVFESHFLASVLKGFSEGSPFVHHSRVVLRFLLLILIWPPGRLSCGNCFRLGTRSLGYGSIQRWGGEVVEALIWLLGLPEMLRILLGLNSCSRRHHWLIWPHLLAHLLRLLVHPQVCVRREWV